MRYLRVVSVVFFLISPAFAEDGDDTLRYYLSKSSLVVSGEIVNKPEISIGGVGVYFYSVKLKVIQVLKGKFKDEELDVMLGHCQQNKSEAQPFLKKEGRVILFLREAEEHDKSHPWRQADTWFGVQQFNTIMEQSLERVVAEK